MDLLAAGERHTCALREDGTVWCFGAGGLSDGGFPIYQSPRQVPEVAGAVALAASSYLTCALQADGGGWCWNIRFGTEVITPWPIALPADLVPLAAPLGPPLGSGAPGDQASPPGGRVAGERGLVVVVDETETPEEESRRTDALALVPAARTSPPCSKRTSGRRRRAQAGATSA